MRVRELLPLVALVGCSSTTPTRAPAKTANAQPWTPPPCVGPSSFTPSPPTAELVDVLRRVAGAPHVDRAFVDEAAQRAGIDVGGVQVRFDRCGERWRATESDVIHRGTYLWQDSDRLRREIDVFEERLRRSCPADSFRVRAASAPPIAGHGTKWCGERGYFWVDAALPDNKHLERNMCSDGTIEAQGVCDDATPTPDPPDPPARCVPELAASILLACPSAPSARVPTSVDADVAAFMAQRGASDFRVFGRDVVVVEVDDRARPGWGERLLLARHPPWGVDTEVRERTYRGDVVAGFVDDERAVRLLRTTRAWIAAHLPTTCAWPEPELHLAVGSPGTAAQGWEGLLAPCPPAADAVATFDYASAAEGAFAGRLCFTGDVLIDFDSVSHVLE